MKGSMAQLGSIGLILDQNEIDVPPQGWSDGNNIRFKGGRVKSAQGFYSVDFTSVVDEVMRGIFVRTEASKFFVYAADTDADGIADAVLTYDGQNEDDITGTVSPDYWDTTNASEDDVVTLCTLHGNVVINNGSDFPVYWDGSASTVTELIFDGSQTWRDRNYKARVIRPWQKFLVAMDITDTGTRDARIIHISSIAEPGLLPPSWDFSDEAEEAIRIPLADTTGNLIDGIQLRQSFVAFKEDAIINLDYVGGAIVHQVTPVSRDRGVIAPNCLVEADGMIFVFGNRDCYWYDGQNMRSALLDQRLGFDTCADYIYKRMDESRKDRCYVTHNIQDKEIFLHRPTAGSVNCDEILVLNYQEGTWSKRDNPDARCGWLGGSLDSPRETWEDGEIGVSWLDLEGSWVEFAYASIARKLYAGGSKIYEMDATNTYDGEVRKSFVQKREIQIGGLDEIHELQTLWPVITGGPVTIKVGRQDVQDGPVIWMSESEFTGGEDRKVCPFVSGYLHAIEIASEGDVEWTLSSMQYEYVYKGET